MSSVYVRKWTQFRFLLGMNLSFYWVFLLLLAIFCSRFGKSEGGCMAQRLYGVTGDMELTGDVPVGRVGDGKGFPSLVLGGLVIDLCLTRSSVPRSPL